MIEEAKPLKWIPSVTVSNAVIVNSPSFTPKERFELAATIVQQVLCKQVTAEKALKKALRSSSAVRSSSSSSALSAPQLDGAGRAEVARRALGTCCLQARLDYMLKYILLRAKQAPGDGGAKEETDIIEDFLVLDAKGKEVERLQDKGYKMASSGDNAPPCSSYTPKVYSFSYCGCLLLLYHLFEEPYYFPEALGGASSRSQPAASSPQFTSTVADVYRMCEGIIEPTRFISLLYDFWKDHGAGREGNADGAGIFSHEQHRPFREDYKLLKVGDRTLAVVEQPEAVPPSVWPSHPARRLEVEYSLPKWMAEEFIDAFGLDNAAALAVKMNKPAGVTFRYNPKADISAIGSAGAAVRTVIAVPLQTASPTAGMLPTTEDVKAPSCSAGADANVSGTSAATVLTDNPNNGGACCGGCNKEVQQSKSTRGPAATITDGAHTVSYGEDQAFGQVGYIDREDAISALLKADGMRVMATPFSPWGLKLVYPAKPNIWGSHCWRGGLMEVQDEGSQLVTLATGCKAGDIAVDLCAGRGGKTLALAHMVGENGFVIAHDVDRKVMNDLVPRLKRAHVPSGRVLTVVSDIGVLAAKNTRVNRMKADGNSNHCAGGGALGAFSQSPAQEEKKKKKEAEEGGYRPYKAVTGGRGGDVGSVGKNTSSTVPNGSMPSVEPHDRHHAVQLSVVKAAIHQCRDRRNKGGYAVGSQENQQSSVNDNGADDIIIDENDHDSGAGNSCRDKQNGDERCCEIKTEEGLGGLADVVLVDGPCSSLGTLRRGPNVRWEIDPQTLSQFPPLQTDILMDGARLVKVGGILVYATCTVRPQENEHVVKHFESVFGPFASHPTSTLTTTATVRRRVGIGERTDRSQWNNTGSISACGECHNYKEAGSLLFEPSPLQLGWGDVVAKGVFEKEYEGGEDWRDRHTVTLLPHIHDTDGFFIARWKRVE